jgi:hypothetical protein
MSMEAGMGKGWDEVEHGYALSYVIGQLKRLWEAETFARRGTMRRHSSLVSQLTR